MRFTRFLPPILSALLLFLVWKQRQEAVRMAATIPQGQWGLLLLASTFQVGMQLNQPALFRALFRMVGVEAGYAEMIRPVWAGKFINVIAPAGGLGETALIFQHAKHRGWRQGQVGMVTVLFFGLNFAVFAGLLVLGLALLSGSGHLNGAEEGAAMVLWGGMVGALTLVTALIKWPRRTELWVERLESRIRRGPLRRWVQEKQLQKLLQEFGAAWAALRENASLGWMAVGHALLVDGLAMAVLGACLAAYGVPATGLNVVAAYAVGTMFSIVSVSPQGLGVVEGSMMGALVSLGVPWHQAGAAVLVYRSLSLWFPVGCGYWATRSLAQRWTGEAGSGGNSGRFSMKLPGIF